MSSIFNIVAKQKPIGWEFENGMSECCPITQSHNSNDPEHMIVRYQWLLSAFIHGLNARCQWRLLTTHQKLRPRCIAVQACCNQCHFLHFSHFCHNVKGDAPSLCMDRETYGVKPFKKTTCL